MSKMSVSPGVRVGWLRRIATAPPDRPTAADRLELDLVGLHLPLRASAALAVAIILLLLDYTQVFIPDQVVALGRVPEVMRVVAVERVVLFGILPMAIVVLVFRDRPSRYGVTLGDWRAGLPLMAAGCAAMTPVVLWFAGNPDVRAYYAPSTEPLPGLLLSNALDLTAAEFLLRGFLMFTLVRAIGPFGVLVAAVPFVFAHLGKPDLELFSTLAGGVIYGWLAWRTRSIVWGSIGHVYILSLVTVTAATAP